MASSPERFGYFRLGLGESIPFAMLEDWPSGPHGKALAPILFDARTNSLTFKGKRVWLTRTEFRIIQTLAAAHGRVIPAEELFDEVWGYTQSVGMGQLLRVHIKNLRARLRDAGIPDDTVETVRLAGFRLRQA